MVLFVLWNVVQNGMSALMYTCDDIWCKRIALDGDELLGTKFNIPENKVSMHRFCWTTLFRKYVTKNKTANFRDIVLIALSADDLLD